MYLNYKDGKLKHAIMGELAKKHNDDRHTITRIWKLVHEAIQTAQSPNLKPNYKGKPTSLDIDFDKVSATPLVQRMNMYSLSKVIVYSKSTIQRLVKKGKIRSHSNAIKPFLTDQNMKVRVMPINLTFECMYNYVHIDEKWYYTTRTSQRYNLLPEEENPHRTCKSKRFITKIMFMAAVARPTYRFDGACVFDRKIGIFSFTNQMSAQRASKSRHRGVLQTKAIDKITKQVTRECLITKVIPAIKEKWPANGSKYVIIQQDNVKPRISNDAHEFQNASNSDGFHIQLQNQPPISPDLNINDLDAPTTVEELVDVVLKAFDETNHRTMTYVWLSLMYCMNEILVDRGNNKYKLPHVGKTRLAGLGLLP
ncbi:hypothetical protein RND81_09G102100 [Saponaria officinalis]|uniref:Transposase n=1 Tax=Saponaria officinalis TaxID=3572 RepID=A0AAW1IJ76_SAPOF